MDAVVTARVPVEIKEQGTTILKELGITTTALINSAFLYLIKNRRLPEQSLADEGASVLSQDQIDSVKASLEAVCVVEGDALGGADFNSVLADLRANDSRLL